MIVKNQPILGLVEEIKIYLPNGKFIRRNAKIDTGARTTAIDIRIAAKIGKIEVYNQFMKLMPKLKITKDNFKVVRRQIRREITPELRRKIPGLRDIRVIPATNGITVRPYIDLEYSLQGKKIKSKVNIVDRKILLYPILIGKNDMAGFLIDPTKNVYRSV